ncbi:hypothetical protein [Nocardiopsis algeriensis]|uniref:Pyruvate/2-oxoglutarate dehydrogenase complex dihydrolipoamide acyltransferase (E2) component n=1 Tax=Nocardiopsis algeriensis TaxID=1478215 RepID=A0A841IU35_9ACTN|nr:hypothetical protein [Nocardiopsis algeriensis]MBB6122197.1 pyruvate/2-oxoglutarate dehydrogenase complex dihydrolipoamide acyltransferase (E2) component [Nocardiopsis algeriensis]
MGALPDPASPIPGTHHDHRRSPEAAPPLRAVPGPRPATAPEPEPTTPPAPPPPAPEPEPPAAQKPQARAPKETGGLDLERIARLRAWAGEHLRPPDLVHQAAPGLKHLWEQALKGDHLPDHRLLRAAEVVRLAVSLPVMAAAILLAWSMVSAARTAALLLGAAALWIVLGSLAGAITELL